MKTRAKVVASFLSCLLGLACSSSSQPAGGSGGASDTGGSATGGTGGTGTGGTGGTSTAGQGGSSGAGTGGADTGGKTGSGTGGAAQGGAAGSTKAAGGAGGEGAGGVATGGVGGKGAGGTTEVGGRGGGNAGTTGAGGGIGGVGPGGSTGGGGSTSSGAVVPTAVASGRDQFAFGDVIFEVDPKVGARIGKLSLGGADMVVSSGTSTDQTDWGAVFWTSPQTAWGTKTSNWPPPVEFDKSAYTGSISGPHLVLDGPENATLGVKFSKDYSADSATGWITVVYTIKASKALQAAPWENCRVPRGGLAFFPSGSSLSKGPLTTMTEAGGIVWFDDKSKTATSASGEKAIADGSGGWMAYALNGNLLLRKFTDTPASAQAPKEGEDEIYPGSGFLELEVQGPYTNIAANDKLTWTVQWRIVKIPSTVDVSAGSATLADFAKQQAAP